MLGFGLQSDVDKLALLGAATRGDNQLALLGAALTRVDAAAAANTPAPAPAVHTSAATDTGGAAATAVTTTDSPPLLSRATRVLDLREVAVASETGGNGGNGGAGLAAQLTRWAGYTLDTNLNPNPNPTLTLTLTLTLSAGQVTPLTRPANVRTGLAGRSRLLR